MASGTNLAAHINSAFSTIFRLKSSFTTLSSSLSLLSTKKEFDGLAEPLGSASSNMVARGWVEGGRWSNMVVVLNLSFTVPYDSLPPPVSCEIREFIGYKNRLFDFHIWLQNQEKT